MQARVAVDEVVHRTLRSRDDAKCAIECISDGLADFRVARDHRGRVVWIDHRTLVAKHGEEKIVMIDATYLKAHRTATSMGVKKGGVDA